MSDKGEKTCPLCAEEMDLTDQQLKPCKCGYEICVWCWHHIMEMAEKDDTEGRCPACRIPYDKERIVGMTANCERLVAGINLEKKKSQKTKPKSSEGRKELSSVRVIQRNLVYIMGLPLHLGDEDLLYRREYFGQYGRVLKVSMSRTAAGVIQQFPNSTCSVYITYSKEEEAIRCIQSVHGYILEGRPLRACFGTTKYCHAWLRNVACTNPDCLYLHEIGFQDDSFTKDEIISAYTRNRVQQIVGPANSQQRRSGNVLPPPLDDYDSSVSASKSIIRNASSHVTASNKGSPSNESSDRAIGLPPAASWATRASNSQPPAASFLSSNGLLKQKSDSSDSRVNSLATASIAQTSSLHIYAPKKLNDENHSIQSKGKVDGLIPVKHYNVMNPHSTSRENHSSLAGAPVAADAIRYSPSSISLNSLDQFGKSSGPISENVRDVHADSHMENLCSDMSVVSIHKSTASKPSGLVRPDYSFCEYGTTRSLENQGLQLFMLEGCNESSASSAVGKASPLVNEMYISSNECDWTSNPQNEASKVSAEIQEDMLCQEDILCFDNQRLKDPEVISRPSYFTNSSKSLVADDSGSHSLPCSGHSATSLGSYLLPVDNKATDVSSSHQFSAGLVSNGTPEILDHSTASVCTIERILAHKNDGKEYMGGQQRSAVTNNTNVSLSSGENSIITDILSLEFDPLDESTSPQVLAKLLRDSDGHDSLNRISKSLKVHNNTQSRFSFAREEEPVSEPFDVEQPHDVCGHISERNRFSPFSQNRVSFVDNFGFVNGLPSNSYGEPNNVGNGRNAIFPSKLSASRSPVSAPPGFSVPSRSPPPGFSHERVDQAYGLTSGNHLLDTYSLLRNSYQASKSGSIASPGDIFTDAANMEVFQGRPDSDSMGFDMRSSYAQRMNALDDEARLKLLLQRSIDQHRNIRYSDVENEHSLVNDSYGFNLRLTDQPQVNNLSPFAQLSSQQPRDSVMSHRIFSRLTDQPQVNNLSHFAQLSPQQPRDSVMSNGINSRLTDQPQVNNLSPLAQLSSQQPRHSVMANGYWDGWNEISGGNSLGMEDHLRNERLGFNRFYSGY